jgi:MFS family permease
VGIGIVILAATFSGFVIGAILLGIGTAMVHPTLLAATSDVTNRSWRASAVGVYRLWRDLGYAVGALLSGVVADLFGVASAIWLVAGLTLEKRSLIVRRSSEDDQLSHRVHKVLPLAYCAGKRAERRLRYRFSPLIAAHDDR